MHTLWCHLCCHRCCHRCLQAVGVIEDYPYSQDEDSANEETGERLSQYNSSLLSPAEVRYVLERIDQGSLERLLLHQAVTKNGDASPSNVMLQIRRRHGRGGGGGGGGGGSGGSGESGRGGGGGGAGRVKGENVDEEGEEGEEGGEDRGEEEEEGCGDDEYCFHVSGIDTTNTFDVISDENMRMWLTSEDEETEATYWFPCLLVLPATTRPLTAATRDLIVNHWDATAVESLLRTWSTDPTDPTDSTDPLGPAQAAQPCGCGTQRRGATWATWASRWTAGGKKRRAVHAAGAIMAAARVEVIRNAVISSSVGSRISVRDLVCAAVPVWGRDFKRLNRFLAHNERQLDVILGRDEGGEEGGGEGVMGGAMGGGKGGTMEGAKEGAAERGGEGVDEVTEEVTLVGSDFVDMLILQTNGACCR